MIKNSKGKPIYYFTELEYVPMPNELPDPEAYLGEINEEIHYSYVELKTTKEEFGSAYHNTPYFPAHIDFIEENQEDILNIRKIDEGLYKRNIYISLDQYMHALKEMIDIGIPMEDITAESLNKYTLDNLPEKEESVKKLAA